MKIAIHGSSKYTFSSRWIKYCESNQIPYKIVNAYDSDIIKQLEGCDCFMWQHTQAKYKDIIMAKQLIYALETSGMKVFPNFKTTWHFDDKIGQKYLLESLGLPKITSYVFYSKEDAIDWTLKTDFPKVFKLRGGAGSMNVLLAKTKSDAVLLINKAFGKGFNRYNWKHRFYEAIRKKKKGEAGIKDILAPLYYSFKKKPNDYSKYLGNENGYAYFQDFIPNNQFDIRIIVVANKAFGIKRMNRKDDFRASGSGTIIYNKEEIDEQCVKNAFDVNKILKAQCIAYDFVFNSEKKPLIVEISFGFSPTAYDDCEGYWDNNLNWHKGPINPYGWMIDSILKQ